MTESFHALQLRRLDGFQNRCLRAIWRSKPAFVSRVSNAQVLKAANAKPLSFLLQRQQVLLFAKVARELPRSILRESVFSPGTIEPATNRYIRKVGRPRREWVSVVAPLAARVAGTALHLDEVVKDKAMWKHLVDMFF